MPIIASVGNSGGPKDDFKPAPPGVHAAVCCDVVDLGMVETTYAGATKMQHKIKVYWQYANVDPTLGVRPLIARKYTLSLFKSNLRRDLESWRGRTFTPDEEHRFDVEKVIGVPCYLNVMHNVSNGFTYANVMAVMPLPSGMPKPTVDPAYVRVKDRPKESVPTNGTNYQPLPPKLSPMRPPQGWPEPVTTEAELGVYDPPNDDPSPF